MGAYNNAVAPSGSASGKSNSISGNTVIINGGSADYAAGAANWLDSADVTGNKVIVNGGTMNNTVTGGTASIRDFGSATTTGNSVTVNGGTVGFAYGGYADISAGALAATANRNSVFINGGTVNDYIGGGYASSASGSALADGNTVTINGGAVGTVSGQIFGGYAAVTYGSSSASVAATGNRVIINGGLINSHGVLGGKAGILDDQGGTAEATYNTVTISGSPTFGSISDFYGGLVTDHTGVTPISGDAFSGNTLNVWNYHGSAIRSVQNFQFYNLVLPTGFQAGDAVLTVTGTADLTYGALSSEVNVGIDGANSPLQAGDAVVLIDAGTLTTNTNLNAAASGMQGVSLNYDFDISATPTQLLATVTKIGLNEQTKAFSEAWLSQLAFTNQGTDLIADQGLFAALDATASRTEKTTITFGALSGSTSRYNTGSHSDVSGVSLLAGLAGSTRQTLGKLTLGAFFEYGDATYDTYNSFINAASVRGRGGLDYTGGGVLAHLEFNPTATGNAWLESSARFGESSVDFRTGDMFNGGRYAAFAGDSNYAAAHFGLGYHRNLNKRNGFDIYAQYLWSRQNADTVKLTTGESVQFDEANSERLRLGSRFVYGLNTYRRAYAGIAWEHEFDGNADASIYGYRLDTAKLTGDTCKLELGFTLLPTKACRFTRNFGLQGYAGKREGVAGNVEVRYAF